WTGDTARQDCAERHADAESLRAARNKYTGTGGIFDADSCRERKDAPPISGTCVFHCNQADETLWHVAGVIDPQMTRGCDLFLPPGD
ncbi:MAG: hypothetical protein ACE5G3_07315, partial [Gammaproteobacteria bacterium]